MLMSPKDDAEDVLRGWSADKLAAYFDSHVTTARRWLRERSAPPMVIQCLRYLQGRLGGISKDWAGWYLDSSDGLLYSPEGDKFTPGAVRAGPRYAEAARSYAGQLAQAQAALEQVTSRRDRIQALADLQNATAAAQAAARALTEDLTDAERRELFSMLDSTRHAHVRMSEFNRGLKNMVDESGMRAPKS